MSDHVHSLGMENQCPECAPRIIINLREELARAKAELSDETLRADSNLRRLNDVYGDLSKQLALAKAEAAGYRETLGIISRNTCCDSCQEAKLFADKALSSSGSEFLSAVRKAKKVCQSVTCTDIDGERKSDAQEAIDALTKAGI